MKFALSKTNLLFLAISFAIVILGFCLMAGGGSDETHFDSGIFSPMRIKVAPAITFLGFILMIPSVLYTPKDRRKGGTDSKNQKQG